MAEETKEFKDLIKQRGSIKGRLTNFKTYFSLLSSSDINKIHESQIRELGLRVAKLEALFSDFEKCQNQIELLCPVLDDQIRERDQIEGPNGQSPYELMFGRSVRTQLHAMLYKPTTSTPRRFPGTLQIREFHPGERVQVRTYNHPHHRWEFAVVTHRIGRLHYRVTTDQGASWTRHLDQMLAAPGVPQQ
ncbi:hypothetical protein ACJJTC_011447 [Scirpophaga incertulas]